MSLTGSLCLRAACIGSVLVSRCPDEDEGEGRGGGTDHLPLDVVVRVEADCLGEYATFLGDPVEVEAREPDRDVFYCPVHQRIRNTVMIIRPLQVCLRQGKMLIGDAGFAASIAASAPSSTSVIRGSFSG